MRTARARLIGLAATLATVAVVAGAPAMLLTIGANPLPKALPTWDGVIQGLTTRDDGTLFLAVITVIAWAAWAFIAAAILLEVLARLRGLHAPTLPGLSMPQSGAHALVGAAVLLFAAAPVLAPSSSAAAVPPPAATAQPWHTTAHPNPGTRTPPNLATAPAPPTAPRHAAPLGGTATSTLPPATVKHTVTSGESLWSIARAHLGDSTRYAEIAALNARVLQGHPDLIHPGTILTIPTAHAARAVAGRSRYTVEKGDTLSGIAQDTLGEANRYREIYDASRRIEQPGGVHLSDPDVIDIGWTLTIPTQHTDPASDTAEVAPAIPAGTPPAAPPPLTPAPGRGGDAARTDTPPRSSATAMTSPGLRESIPDQDAWAVGGAGASTQFPSAWMIAGLSGGPVLAGSMWLLLRRRRGTQSRHRRPGRTFPALPPVLAPVEKTLAAAGPASAVTLEFVDAALRALASSRARTGQPMPALVGAELTTTALTLHLAAQDALPAPWTDRDGDGRAWQLPAELEMSLLGEFDPEQPAPYPLLVTVGTTDSGDPWLLNLEDLTVALTGDPTNAADLARYITAELACNPWSAGVGVHCTGPATDVAPLNPDRITPHHPDTGHDTHSAARAGGLDRGAVGDVINGAVAAIERATDEGVDTVTGRAHQLADDSWPAQVLLLDSVHADTPALGQLLDLVADHPGRTGTAVIITGAHDQRTGVTIELTSGGRVLVAHTGWDLVAVGLTRDEAQGCAALLAATDDVSHAAIPVDQGATSGWRAYTDHAGALREEQTLPRHTPTAVVGEPAVSILPAPDQDYLDHGATTSLDLATLAPQVTPSVRDALEQADPTLEDEVAAWFAEDCPLPRLSLLGPVRARTRGTALTERKPYMTEVLAYVATRPYGATPEEVAHVMGISIDKARGYMRIVRDWLGTNPRTGEPHIPAARQSPAARTAGHGMYQVIDILIDADLFRRLRARALSRGPDGITDLDTALRLVSGRPFDQLRNSGWAWLAEGDRLDQHMVCAVVDVAHTAVTAHLNSGNHAAARVAAETAARAAPQEDIPRLDLARVAHAQGLHDQERGIVIEEVCNRTDDEYCPMELSERTEQVITGTWVKDHAVR